MFPSPAGRAARGRSYWYSRYDTGSYFSVKEARAAALTKRRRNGKAPAQQAEKADAGCWRFVTHEGMSNTIVTLFAGPNNTTYEVEIHWLFDGSTEENQWGWNRDRAVEGEAEVLAGDGQKLHGELGRRRGG